MNSSVFDEHALQTLQVFLPGFIIGEVESQNSPRANRGTCGTPGPTETALFRGYKM